jgi:uncharacterized protein YcsI (UPF0317 family)
MAKQRISMNDLVVSINHTRIDFYDIKHRSTWSNEPEHAGSLSWDNSVLGFIIEAYSYTETAIQEYLKDKGIYVQHLEKGRSFYIAYEDYINLITLIKLKENSYGT